MILNLAVAATVLLIAYMWTAQGAFSAAIHFVCTLVAGAVALAVWEPLVYGVLLGVKSDIAWTLGLLLPFLVTLVLLRVLTDKLIATDVKVPPALDFAGGGVFGLGSGLIAAGFLVIGIGFMPMGSALLGHQTMQQDTAGNFVRTSSLWIPADTITARLYEHLSTGGFSAGANALARRQPHLDEQASLVRATSNDRGSTAIKPDDFTVLSAYKVEAPSLPELTADGFDVAPDGSPKPQEITRTDGSSYPAGTVLRGYSVRFESSASEQSGQVVVGPGQVRLVCRLADGSSEGFQPIAVIAQSSGNALAASRFRFDSRDVFIGSAGRAKQPVMSFEFAVPGDAEPVDLLVKNARVPVGSLPLTDYSVKERDDAVYAMDLVGLSGQGPTGPRPAPGVAAPSAPSGPVDSADMSALREAGVRVSTVVQGVTLSRQGRGGLKINDKNEITGGSHTFATDDITGKRVPTDLKVTDFAVLPGTALVQVDVSLNKRASLLGRAVDKAQQLLPPLLTDSLGQQYEAVGFVFAAGDRVEIRYEASEPIRAMSQLPGLSRSRPTDSLTLLFQVNKGVDLTSFNLGGQVEVLDFNPPLHVR